MIERRLFSTLLALCPAFVQRAFAGGGLAASSDDICGDIVAILQRKRPQIMASAEIAQCTIRLGPVMINLDNLALRVAQAHPTERESMVLYFMDNVLAGTGPIVETDGAKQPFEIMKSNLRPQIVANGYLENEAHGLLSRPWSQKASVTLVEVNAGMHRFVRADEAEAWGLDMAAIEGVAVENLDAASVDVPVTLDRQEGGAVLGIVSFGDGFDASRVLAPAFRRRLLSQAATPLQAAVPNRDTLMIWTPGVAPYDKMRSLVREFYDEGPYSRTDEIFELKAETLRPI